MTRNEWTLELIASLQREQLTISNIVSDLSYDARLTGKELEQEITRSQLRRESLAFTEENLLIAGVSQ